MEAFGYCRQRRLDDGRTMNWGRGIFRLWTAAAVLWITVAIAVHWRELACKWLPAGDGSEWERSTCNPFVTFDAASMDTLGRTIGVPLVALVVGGLIYWIAKGFRRAG
jgi:hypothetical protein